MAKSVEYYLSRGLDKKTAEHFANGRRTVISVFPREDFTLALEFDNGERRILDCKPFLEDGTVFAPFQKYENFRRVYLDEDHSVCWDIDPNIDSKIFWNNKVDICPDTCYIDSEPC